MNIRITLAIALFFCAPIHAAEQAGRAAMENYWAAQPDAAAVIPGPFLVNLKNLSWPDPRPEAREKYLARPEVQARELKEEEVDPLLAGLAKRSRAVKRDLEAAQSASDESRYQLWQKNVAFFQQGIGACAAGTISGAARVALLEAALGFVKEGVPRFYLREITDDDNAVLARMSGRVQALIADLYRQGQYVPDDGSMLWAERTGKHLAGGITPVSETEKRGYYKIIARLRAFDPRAAQAESGEILAAAPADAATDPRMEAFLQGLVSRCDKTIAGLNLAAAAPSRYTEIGNQAEQAIRDMLASFPDGWQQYPRARWAHGWFSDALMKSGKANAPADRGMLLFKALDKYQAGLKAGS